MKVLVLGKGGREHALVWKLAQSKRVERVYCAPGNAGTAIDGTNVTLDINDFDRVVAFVKKEGIGLTVVGPEEPLVNGIVDHFHKHELRIFGPTKAAAQIEGSKIFAKELMRIADVPTADFVAFDHPDPARNYVRSREYAVLPDGKYVSYPFSGMNVVVEAGVRYLVLENERRVRVSPPDPLVVKADGLAAGKGVFVCEGTEDALHAIERIMAREEFGRAAGRRIVIEGRISGVERSSMAIVAGRAILPLAPVQDYKRALDGDKGGNTGGMGAYCPAPLAHEITEMIDRDVFVPVVHTMRRKWKVTVTGREMETAPFRGILYAGVMISQPQGPRVLEFNCRLGDPETQPLLMRLKTDLVDVMEAAIEDRLEAFAPNGLEWDDRYSVCVVMTAGGYPGKFEKGFAITGLARADSIDGVKVFHAGTRLDGERVVTDGGRVLGVTALGATLEEARERAYRACSCIEFREMFYRRDIAVQKA